MIPILFDKSETLFTSNGIGRLIDCISCKVTEERNGIYELELEYPITGKWYHEMIENGGIIGVIHDDNHDIQPFDIYLSSAPIDGIVTFNAHHISYRLNNIILQPFSATSAATAVAAISTNSVNTNPFTFSTDKTVTADFVLNRPASVRSILFGEEGSLLDVYGTAEFKFDKFNVEMLLHRGTDTGVTVRYGKNMTDIEQVIDDSETYNALAPYWTDGVVNVYPTGIIVQPTTPISPVKPVILDVSDKFEKQPKPSEVEKFARNYLDSSSPWEKDENIRINFIALWQSPEYENVAAIQRVGLCDTVSVYYTDMGVVAEKKKVVRVVFDVLAERYEELELGSLQNSYVAIETGSEDTVSSETINNLSSAFASCISGKKVSIIGDSISTFDAPGYKTEGYSQYYPTSLIPDVSSVFLTWWKRVLDASGCVLEANASYSGSRATNTDPSKPSFCDRCNATILGDPDTILVALGTNDSINSVAIGDFDFTTAYTSLSEATFATAYRKGLEMLKVLYPNAQIVCVSLAMGSAYKNVVIRTATALGLEYVGVSDYERGSGSHPNAHGMRQIASAVLALQHTDSNYRTEVTPALYIENGDFFIADDEYTLGTPPSANTNGRSLSWKDVQNTTIALIRFIKRANGENRFSFYINGIKNGASVNQYFYMEMDASGNPNVVMSDPDAWRIGLGLCYAKNEVFAPSNMLALPGYVSSSTKSIYLNVATDKSLENISAITVQKCTGAVRGGSGYVDGSSSSTNWLTGYTVAASKVSNNLVSIVITKSSALSNVTNNTPVSANLTLELKFT